MRNILLISALFPPEPVVSAKLSEDLASCLSKTHKVTVVAPRATRPFGFDLSKQNQMKKLYDLINVDSYTCPESNFFGRLRESYSFGLACKAYILDNQSQIDCIYMSTWPVLAQYFTVKVAYKLSIPIVTHVQDIYPESLSTKMPILGVLFNLLFIPLDKVTLGKSKKVIVISEKMKKYLAKSRQIPSNKILVVKNWQDEEAFINFENAQKAHVSELQLFTFMYMGNIGPVAGVDFLIKSFNKSKLENCRLVIAGSGSKRIELEKLVSSRQIDRVSFVDVPDTMVPEIQAYADVMLLPIKKGAASSSIPSKLPAYMFSKKPVIASLDSDSDSAKVINDANSGWVVEPENMNMLIDVMREVSCMTKSLLEVRGRNGFKFAMKNFSKKNNLRKIINIISEI